MKGTISVSSENIFPVIKKWLYSDKDIFLRELVSNGCDAVTKLKKLVSLGEADIEDEPVYRIDVTLDREKKTLTVSDTGIGMTAEEIDKYITQIAFSGASDFLEKYKEEDDKGSQIIGHFGLGFYSAFMVSDSVEIDSLSYQKGASPAKWICDGGMEYEMEEGTRKERGTTITLHIAEDSEEFLDEYTVRGILDKYCGYLPVEVYFESIPTKEEKEAEQKRQDEAREKGEAIDAKPAPKPINDINPLWMKKPAECEDKDYKEFYTKMFHDFNEPLFWIHLNVDYPFNLKGILYFPKVNHELGLNEGQVKLFNNQVFVADNVKEVTPEFLMLLKGVIDCPDLPLNVSRSFLQNDGYVKKICAHITKKIADKLNSLYKNDRDNYNRYWDDINIFIKYGCMRDDKFYDRVKDSIIYKTTEGEYLTLADYIGDKEDKTVYYANDEKQQSQYINMFKEQGIKVVLLPTMMDTHFISFIEMKEAGTKFKRIDSNLADLSQERENNEKADKKISKLFDKIVPEGTKVEVHSLKDESVPAVLILSEESRRMKEMYASYGQQMAGMADMFKEEYTFVINDQNPLIKKLPDMDKEMAKLAEEHIYDLAEMANKPLTPERMTSFIERSRQLLDLI